jgi:hypothetical protein
MATVKQLFIAAEKSCSTADHYMPWIPGARLMAILKNWSPRERKRMPIDETIS